MIYITRQEGFCAAHKLSRDDWSAEKNFEVFGNCANPNWHGHNYNLVVTIKGDVNPENGFLINLKDLSKIIKEHIISKVDHFNLNLDVDFMKGKLTSTENLAIAIWNQLEPHFNKLNVSLHCVKIFETEHNFVEYFGD